MRSCREKYCGAGISNALSYLFLKQKGGWDFIPSGRDLAGPMINCRLASTG